MLYRLSLVVKATPRVLFELLLTCYGLVFFFGLLYFFFTDTACPDISRTVLFLFGMLLFGFVADTLEILLRKSFVARRFKRADYAIKKRNDHLVEPVNEYFKAKKLKY
ncbi:MAG: hypothetical protein KBC21_03270 [Candidatus Pacebacteria bacterium]|jgi:hypothetical protein|nr:hypothetical protein [Candidatus Paceibacterota bacterium]